MKQTKQQLYERIMKKVAPIVKQAINEKFNSINEAASKKRKNSRLNESYDADEFFDLTIDFYDKWITYMAAATLNELDEQGKIYPTMDEEDLTDIVIEKFDELLNQAVGGDWWEIGKQSGYDDSELEDLYVDRMQSKCDCIFDYCNNDDED